MVFRVNVLGEGVAILGLKMIPKKVLFYLLCLKRDDDVMKGMRRFTFFPCLCGEVSETALKFNMVHLKKKPGKVDPF